MLPKVMADKIARQRRGIKIETTSAFLTETLQVNPHEPFGWEKDCSCFKYKPGVTKGQTVAQNQ